MVFNHIRVLFVFVVSSGTCLCKIILYFPHKIFVHFFKYFLETGNEEKDIYVTNGLRLISFFSYLF